MLVAVLAASCSSPATRGLDARAPTPRPERSEGWRKDRYVPVRRAVARLERHVDVPVVLPRDRLAGVRDLDRWVADRRYLDWRRYHGRRVGTLVVRRGDEILWIHYGHAVSDGCGGRETAVETYVLGEPALVWTVRGARPEPWSEIVWPVRPRGRTGAYGLSGTFESWEIVRLAESMEARRREALRDRSC